MPKRAEGSPDEMLPVPRLCDAGGVVSCTVAAGDFPRAGSGQDGIDALQARRAQYHLYGAARLGDRFTGYVVSPRRIKWRVCSHHQKAVADYLWNKAGSLRWPLHSREAGIKPFIASVRNGFSGYYLPGPGDHGEEHSEVCSVFSTYKSHLPAIGRLMKCAKAAVSAVSGVRSPKSPVPISTSARRWMILTVRTTRISPSHERKVESHGCAEYPNNTRILETAETRKGR